jgi:hypothetical protein
VHFESSVLGECVLGCESRLLGGSGGLRSVPLRLRWSVGGTFISIRGQIL